MSTETLITSKNVDLTNCDREQIQYAGAIQPHGVLLVVREPDLAILQASLNAAELLKISAGDLVGAPLSRVFSADQLSQIRARLGSQKLDAAPIHLCRAELALREFDVLAHRYDQVLILELEARPLSSDVPVLDLYSDLRAALSALQGTAGLQPFFDLAVQYIRTFTGFDRVMVYKFMEDGSGWVRSEAVSEGLEAYLGLHYPPSDIPAPARRLFSLTWLRHQPDIGYKPVPLFPEDNPVSGQPLDMSYAFLRSVSIMYVDYLKNMGTQSSMVMTLLKEGKLWGLIACHHHTAPKHVPFETRVACEFLAHMVSVLMSTKEDVETLEYRMKLRTTHAQLVEKVARRQDFVSGFVDDSPNLLDFMKCSGAAIVVNNRILTLGSTPAESDIEALVQWLSTMVNRDVYATDFLSSQYPEGAKLKDSCAGLLALRFSKSKNDFLLWFRPETIQTVNWAGDPKKPVDISDDGQRLMPRTSFALWKESVRLKSEPWADLEVEAATELRAALLELVLGRAEELGRLYSDLERSYADLDSFAYVASHDLKEPLRGIHNFAEMLNADYGNQFDEQGKSKLATLSRLSARMTELIDSLLEYSRMGRIDFSHTEVDLNEVLNEALDSLQVLIRSAGVTVEISRPLPPVKGDPFRLQEVFTNLISNAVKYNDKKDKLVEVGFLESPAGGSPVFFVRDNGIGIDKSHHEDIFGIFRRLHGRDKFGGGSGAGLTITRKMIERHGGRIWLESEPGQGTSFFFVLGESASGVRR